MLALRAKPINNPRMWIKALAAILLLPVPVAAEPLLVFAAASLKGPLDAIAGEDITISYAGSGTLARQIQQGAPADAVILANSAWMDVLESRGRLAAASRQTVLSNQLVLVSKDLPPFDLSPDTLKAALANGRLAIGRTASVPAGIYGKEALENLGLWATAEQSLAEVDNVRAALTLAIRGEVPLALVYASDAQSTDAVTTVASIPTETHSQIKYEAAQVKGGRDASAFLALLDDITPFKAAGFLPPPLP